jgi:hypothetical protein
MRVDQERVPLSIYPERVLIRLIESHPVAE